MNKLAKRLLRQTIGLWPLLESRNRVLMLPGTLTSRLNEHREVRRLKRENGMVGPALVVTVIPTYRRPESLQRAIASALNQTIEDHIVIVVDDGGGLPSLPSHPRLHAVSLSSNTGVLGVVRNVGIRLTRSTYLAFLDDDNEWMPKHLELTLDALTAEHVDIVYTALRRQRSDGRILDVLSRDFDRRVLSDSGNFLDINAVVIRRDREVIFSRIPRVKATLPKEDWEFIYRLTKRRRVFHVPVPTVSYLVHEDSYYTDWKDTAQ